MLCMIQWSMNMVYPQKSLLLLSILVGVSILIIISFFHWFDTHTAFHLCTDWSWAIHPVHDLLGRYYFSFFISFHVSMSLFSFNSFQFTILKLWCERRDIRAIVYSILTVKCTHCSRTHTPVECSILSLYLFKSDKFNASFHGW